MKKFLLTTLCFTICLIFFTGDLFAKKDADYYANSILNHLRKNSKRKSEYLLKTRENKPMVKPFSLKIELDNGYALIYLGNHSYGPKNNPCKLIERLQNFDTIVKELGYEYTITTLDGQLISKDYLSFDLVNSEEGPLLKAKIPIDQYVKDLSNNEYLLKIVIPDPFTIVEKNFFGFKELTTNEIIFKLEVNQTGQTDIFFKPSLILIALISFLLFRRFKANKNKYLTALGEEGLIYLKKKVSNGEIGEALDYALEKTGNKKKIRDILCLKSRFSIINRKNNQGLLGHEDYTIETNRITYSLLSTVMQV